MNRDLSTFFAFLKFLSKIDLWIHFKNVSSANVISNQMKSISWNLIFESIPSNAYTSLYGLIN